MSIQNNDFPAIPEKAKGTGFYPTLAPEDGPYGTEPPPVRTLRTHNIPLLRR